MSVSDTRRSVYAFVVALALALAGCGDDDQTTSTGVSDPVSTTTTATTATTTGGDDAGGGGEAAGAAGGGGSASQPEPGSGSGAGSPTAAAVAVLTAAGSPEQACGSYVTEGLIQDSYGGEENCIAARKGVALADTIEIDADGGDSTTHLVVVPTGGTYDGARVEVDLVREDGGYRVDALDAHVPAGP